MNVRQSAVKIITAMRRRMNKSMEFPVVSENRLRKTHPYLFGKRAALNKMQPPFMIYELSLEAPLVQVNVIRDVHVTLHVWCMATV